MSIHRLLLRSRTQGAFRYSKVNTSRAGSPRDVSQKRMSLQTVSGQCAQTQKARVREVSLGPLAVWELFLLQVVLQLTAEVRAAELA